jgi:DNA-binding LacI/PurR family transcriptional regulator
MNYRRLTQADVAKRANVTQTTVSLAMRHHPSLPESTRKRIIALAEKMGYRPDPMLSSLVAYRRSVQQASFQGTIAWATNYPTEEGWCNGQQVGYFEGAEQRAKELGYKLGKVWLRQPGLKPERIKQILLTRGVHGLLLAPQSQPHTAIDLDWKFFSAVAFGHTLQLPQLHIVMNHQFRNMANLVRKLYELGYERVGFAMPSSQDERTEHNYLAGYLVEQVNRPKAERMPYLLEARFQQTQFCAWLKKYRPQVIITDLKTASLLRMWLNQLGLVIPRDVGLALPNVPYGDPFYSGIDENPLLVGASAIDAVVGMMHRNECGVPLNPRFILIEGRWFAGESTRQ